MGRLYGSIDFVVEVFHDDPAKTGPIVCQNLYHQISKRNHSKYLSAGSAHFLHSARSWRRWWRRCQFFPGMVCPPRLVNESVLTWSSHLLPQNCYERLHIWPLNKWKGISLLQMKMFCDRNGVHGCAGLWQSRLATGKMENQQLHKSGCFFHNCRTVRQLS